MKRVIGNKDVLLIECVSPQRGKWRVRWDVRENGDGSASYMEKEFIGKPSTSVIKALVTEWVNSRVEETILSGFEWNGMKVWLSSENQFNYKAAYDLAEQSSGATLPVTFKFGTDGQPVYHTFSSLDDLADFYTKAMRHIQDTLAEGWRSKDSFSPDLYL